jgi:putative transposase
VRKRTGVEERVRIVREAEAALGQGTAVEEVCRKFDVTQSTLFRWRRQYGGLTSPEAKRLKELERENAQLKTLLAESELDKRILKAALKGKA